MKHEIVGGGWSSNSWRPKVTCRCGKSFLFDDLGETVKQFESHKRISTINEVLLFVFVVVALPLGFILSAYIF